MKKITRLVRRIAARLKLYPGLVNFPAAILLILLSSTALQAQFFSEDTTWVDPGTTVYPNSAAGEFTPGKGFQLVKSKFASLNLSLYGMARWVNQRPGEDTWYDHVQGRGIIILK